MTNYETIQSLKLNFYQEELDFKAGSEINGTF